MKSTENKGTDEAAIRSMIDDYIAGVREKDVSKLMRLYARDVVTYGMAPPLQEKGIELLEKQSKAWLETWEGPLILEPVDLKISASGDVGYSHMLNRVRGQKKGGDAVDMYWRVTLCFRKNEGRWFVTHDHNSEPFDMTTFKARLDLKP